MNEFQYQRPSSVSDAVQMRAANADAVYLAGGMTLIPTLKQRLAEPSHVVDLSAIDSLHGIHLEGNVVKVGAMTTHDEVARSDHISALATLASQIGDAQVRNRGTIGGSIANSDPAADYPAAVVGLGATIHTTDRDIPGDEFFTGLFENALDSGELITGVSFNVPKRAAYAKFPNPASRYAVVGVMVAETSDGVRVGVTGAGPCAFRASGMETALSTSFSSAALDAVTVDGSDFNSDLHASAEYRAHLVKVMAKRAVDSLAG